MSELRGGERQDPPWPLYAVLYPDLDSVGGLPSALLSLARSRGISIGELDRTERPHLAVVRGNTGIVSVGLGKNERWFSISVMARDGRVRAYGGTDDLSSALGMIAYWHTGPSLPDLASRYPFIEVDRLAKAYDDGNAVQVRWEQLLNDEELATIRPLLLAASGDPRLAKFFPSVTHLTLLRLAIDYTDRSSHEVLVTFRQDGSLQVKSTLDGTVDEVGSIPEAVECAVARLPTETRQ